MKDNPRGYAYQALANAYDRSMGWQQYAALARDGLMPSKYEYIEEGLDMFDRSHAPDMTEAKAMIDTIIKEMGRSLVEQLKGKHSYPTDSEGTQYIITRYDTTLDMVVSTTEDSETVTLSDTLGEVELGFMQVEDADEMRYRLRVLADRLRPADMDIIASYVEGNHGSLTEACGGKVEYQLFTRRMARATKGMVMA